MASLALRPINPIEAFHKLLVPLAAVWLALVLPVSGDASEGTYRRIGNAAIRILYDQPSDRLASSILKAFPTIREDLRQTLGWQLKRPVTIVLLSDREQYLRLSSSPLFQAFAVPQRRLVVMDQSRSSPDGARIDGTLRHELCHLLLHEYIETDRLPRWLDEGVCQWVSDGFSELMDPARHRRSEQMLQSGLLVPFVQLERAFPVERQGLELAYAQSRLFVDFLVLERGRERLLQLLQALAAGNGLEASMRAVYGRSLKQLTGQWREQMATGVRRILLLIASHLYQILFFLGALLAVVRFIHKRRRLRAYSSDEDEDFDS